MLSSALRFTLAVLMLAGYVPVPAKVAGLIGRREAGSCCAPKACCVAHGSACSGGGACVGGSAGAGSVLGAVLVAGGCGTPVPRITPVSLDPTLAPRADAIAAPRAGVGSRVETLALIFSTFTPDPSVPPPRA
jgi:hypothetical protein